MGRISKDKGVKIMSTSIYDSLTKEQKKEVLKKLPVFGKKYTIKKLEALIEIISKDVKDGGR